MATKKETTSAASSTSSADEIVNVERDMSSPESVADVKVDVVKIQNRVDAQQSQQETTTNVCQDILPKNNITNILTNKKRIMNRYFDELSQTYAQAHNKDLKEFNLKG